MDAREIMEAEYGSGKFFLISGEIFALYR